MGEAKSGDDVGGSRGDRSAGVTRAVAIGAGDRDGRAEGEEDPVASAAGGVVVVVAEPAGSVAGGVKLRAEGEAGEGAARRRPTSPRTIHSFLTDGTLARLCRALTGLSGVRVELRDEQGRRIEALEDGPGWSTEARASALPEGARLVPMVLDGAVIGNLIIAPGAVVGAGSGGEGPGGEAARRWLEQTVELLALTAQELCHDVQQLRQRVHELATLLELSAVLMSKGGIEEMLDAALVAALGALELDAGSLVLLPEGAGSSVGMADEELDVQLKASRNLSEGWLRDPRPLSRGRLFDRLCLGGEVVSVEDLRGDARVLAAERLEVEGLASFLGVGLIQADQPVGVMRLYSRVRRAFSDQDRRLVRAIGQQAAAAVEHGRAKELEQSERRIRRALEMAGAVQQRMLPREMPRVAGLDVASWLKPSYELSGDFYDIFETPGLRGGERGGSGGGPHLGLLIGDVVGKGISAALMMASLRASLRAYLDADGSLAGAMSRMNTRMTRDTLVREFATVWCGVIDPVTLRLRSCSAGHEPPIVFSVSPGPGGVDVRWRMLAIGGLVVGVVDPMEYEERESELAPGELLLAYTDGIIDARSPEGERFGKSRLIESVTACLRDHPSASAADVVERVRWELTRFVGSAAQADDNTLVAVRVAPGHGASTA